MKVYEKIETTIANNLKIEVYYNKGGMNYFSYKNEARGYYLSVSPVNRTPHEGGKIFTESYTAFTGTKVLLMEVKRKSEKAYDQAVQIAMNGKIEELKQHVKSQNNIN